MVRLEFQPRAVIFDLDGLVLDSERCYFRCWERAAAELGYHLDVDLYADLIGLSNEEAELELAHRMGKDFPVGAFSRLWTMRWEELLQRERIPAKPGLEELLEILEVRQIPRAIASSSREADVLRSLGNLRGRFTAILSRDDVARGKPAPDLFLVAAQRLGIPPNGCVALEDSEAGVQAAVAAGMPVILVPDLKAPSAAMASAALMVCASLHDVRELMTESG